MDIDTQKIQNLVNELNAASEPDARPWIAIDGYHALTSLEIDAAGEATFNPGSGVPLKTFYNTETGEVKVYHINAFKDDNGE